MFAILVMEAKLATLSLLEIKVFLGKRYDAMISAHEVTYKILLRDSNYIIDVAM